jgi:hypothetical protein
MAIASAVEARVPFLAQDLVELSPRVHRAIRTRPRSR